MYARTLILSAAAICQSAALRAPRRAPRAGLRASAVKGADKATVTSVPDLDNGMEMRQLGDSDLVVSEVCLGTMTWGEQNTEAEAHEQLDAAFDRYGINFIDTAELYPVPPKPETQGSTDRYIASWLKGRSRSDVVLATKVCGPSGRTDMRDDGSTPRLTKDQIIESVDKSLARLGTDHVDLIQLHWPDRYVPIFGAGGYDKRNERESIDFEETMEGLDAVVRAGKVRHVGVSNETPYGVGRFCELAANGLGPKICSIQNCFHLMDRTTFESGGLAESCSPRHYNVGLLAYSPLAGGALTGKYLDWDAAPDGARFKKFGGFMGRYNYPMARHACELYAKLAKANGMTATELSLAWVYSRNFVTSTIIGATSLAQLEENVLALNKVEQLKNDPSITVGIDAIDRMLNDPMKLPGVQPQASVDAMWQAILDVQAEEAKKGTA